MNKFFQNIKKYKKYMYKNALSELKSEVSGSYLSWLWWFIEPCAYTAIYYLVFGIFFNSEEKYFLVFVLLGLTIWQFFQRMISCSVNLISKNREILTKVYVPKYILLISKSYVYLFKMMISLLLSYIIIVVTNVPITLNYLNLFILLPYLYIITFSFCIILMHHGVYLGDLKKLIEITLKFMFYLSGVFYSIPSRLESPYASIVLNLNPVAVAINEFRNILLYNINPRFNVISIWFIICVVILFNGIRIIHKYENSYAKVV